MDVDSALLRTLCALAEDPHMGRAAARLGVTQQAVSQRIARLEALTGLALLDRSNPRRPRLTPEGAELVPWARTAVEHVDRFAGHAGRRARGTASLRVDVMGSYLAPAAWAAHGAEATGRRVDLVHRPPEATAEHLLATGRADVAFGRADAVAPPWPAGIRSRRVHLEPLAFLVPRGHPWSRRDGVRLAELAGHGVWFPMLLAPLEWRTYIAELDAAFGLGIDTEGSSLTFEGWAHGVSAGATPPSLIGEAMTLPDVSLRTVPIVDPTPVFPWSALWVEGASDAEVEALLAGCGLPARAPVADPGTWMPRAA